MLEWVPAGLNTGALSGAKASSSRTRDKLIDFLDPESTQKYLQARNNYFQAIKQAKRDY
jgi:hypothetical protein